MLYNYMLQRGISTNPYVDAAHGFDIWHHYVSSFNLGKKLGIDLPNEKSGRIPSHAFYDKVYGKNRWAFRTIFSLGIGQGEILTSPMQLGETWVIVASKGGDDDHPAWFLNLQADPTVEVDIRGKKSVRTARLATPQERSTMWPQITSVYTGYAGYQERTQREIPLVLLEPQA